MDRDIITFFRRLQPVESAYPLHGVYEMGIYAMEAADILQAARERRCDREIVLLKLVSDSLATPIGALTKPRLQQLLLHLRATITELSDKLVAGVIMQIA